MQGFLLCLLAAGTTRPPPKVLIRKPAAFTSWSCWLPWLLPFEVLWATSRVFGLRTARSAARSPGIDCERTLYSLFTRRRRAVVLVLCYLRFCGVLQPSLSTAQSRSDLVDGSALLSPCLRLVGPASSFHLISGAVMQAHLVRFHTTASARGRPVEIPTLASQAR